MFLTPRASQSSFFITAMNGNLGDAQAWRWPDSPTAGPAPSCRWPRRRRQPKATHRPGDQRQAGRDRRYCLRGGIDRLNRGMTAGSNTMRNRKNPPTRWPRVTSIRSGPCASAFQAKIAAAMVAAPRNRRAQECPVPPAASLPSTGRASRPAPPPARPSAVKPMIPTVEQARIAPLDIHPQRHDGREKRHVQDRQRQVPALEHPRARMNRTATGRKAQGCGSYRFPLEQAGGHEQEHEDQDREADGEFVIGRQKLQQPVRRHAFGHQIVSTFFQA
jgi:hypothetical protein